MHVFETRHWITLVLTMAFVFGLATTVQAEAQEGKVAVDPVMLFPIVKANKWGFMDQTGKVVIEPQYKLALDFHEGMACVGIKALRGFIDATGKMVVKPRFGWAGNFSEGMVRVNKHKNMYGEHVEWYKATTGWGYMNKSGKIVFGQNYGDKLSDFSHGVTWIRRLRKSGYMDKDGKPVAYEGDEGSSFSDGFAAVRKGGKYGYIDRTMKFVIQPVFSAGRPFSEGFAPVATSKTPPPDDKRSYRQWIKKPGFKWGFIDKTGKVVIKETFDDVWLFSEGLAPVKVGGKWGYLNTSGEVVIKPTYDYVWPFSEGKGRVLVGEKSGYIDKTGKLVIEAKFDAAWEFLKGLARVGVGEKEGYINHEGKFVWEPTE